MPTCPRCAALALVLLALAGCDSNNPGRDVTLVQGRYMLEALSFEPISDLPDADVAARLNLDETTLSIDGGGTRALLSVTYTNGDFRLIDLQASISRGRIVLTATDREPDEAYLAALLLPRSFTLTYETVDDMPPRVLSTSQNVSGINLEAFDASRYRGELDKQGALVVRFRRP